MNTNRRQRRKIGENMNVCVSVCVCVRMCPCKQGERGKMKTEEMGADKEG